MPESRTAVRAPAKDDDLPRKTPVHELSICQALLAQVTELAMSRGAQAVERITIEVGPLSGVDAGLLASAFDIVRAGSCASQALLHIETIAVELRCDVCGVQSAAVANRLVCASCGAYRTRVMAGDDLRLRRVELRVAGPVLSAARAPAESAGQAS